MSGNLYSALVMAPEPDPVTKAEMLMKHERAEEVREERPALILGLALVALAVVWHRARERAEDQATVGALEGSVPS